MRPTPERGAVRESQAWSGARGVEAGGADAGDRTVRSADARPLTLGSGVGRGAGSFEGRRDREGEQRAFRDPGQFLFLGLGLVPGMFTS